MELKKQNKATDIGDVAGDGWYCIGTKPDGSPLEMSPPVMMTQGEVWRYARSQDASRLPDAGQLTQMFKAMSENKKILAAIAEGRIKGLDPEPAGAVWGMEFGGGLRCLPRPICQYSDTGDIYFGTLPLQAEARFIR